MQHMLGISKALNMAQHTGGPSGGHANIGTTFFSTHTTRPVLHSLHLLSGIQQHTMLLVDNE